MAGSIPREFIDDVLVHTDIVEVINSRVPLKRSGSNYMACCPFHGEKTPSFSVNQNKQFYHCFGCGVSGDAIKFLTEYEHSSFIEAIEELAQMAGLQVPLVAYSHNEKKQDQGHFELLDQVANYYQYQMTHHQQASQVQHYIQQRGLSAEVVKRFTLGYSPPGWNNILNVIGAADPAKIQSLFDTGMLIKREDNSSNNSSNKAVQVSNKPPSYYDRFRERLMFPIRDYRGRTIAFGGRILGDDKPKYLNSPETKLFHKGQELYGLYELKQAVRKIEKILVVEGYMDVVSLAQFGVNYSVATLGTATTAEHLQKIFKLCNEVFFCFDGDRAGREAAWRAMNNALPMIKSGKYAHFMFLPDGEDPDSLIRAKGKEGFEAEMDKAMTFSDFFFNTLMKQVNIDSYEGRDKLRHLSQPYLSKITDDAFKRLMKARLEELAQLSHEQKKALDSDLSLSSEQTPREMPRENDYAFFDTRATPFTATAAQRNAPSPIKKVIAYLLQYPQLAERAGNPECFNSLDMENVSLFIQLLDLLQNDPHLTTARILAHWQDSAQNNRHYSYLVQLATAPLLIEDEQAVRCEFDETLQLFFRQLQQQRFSQLHRKAKNQGLGEAERIEFGQLLKLIKAS